MLRFPRRPPPPTLRLDDTADFLARPEGRDIVRDVYRAIERDGERAHPERFVITIEEGRRTDGPKRHDGVTPALPRGPEHVKDPFDRAIVEFDAQFNRKPHAPRAIVPAAVVDAFASVASDEGEVTAKAVRRRFGRRGEDVFNRIAEGLSAFPEGVPAPRPELKWSQLRGDVFAKVLRSAPRCTFQERMPLVAQVRERFGGSEALAGRQMISLQHLFPSTLALFDELDAAGLEQHRFKLGKPYSTRPEVWAELKFEGRSGLESFWGEVGGAGASSDWLKKAAEMQLGNLFKSVDPTRSDAPRFLLLDEGGYLTCALHERFPQFAPLCAAVEQTEYGIREIAKLDLACPVINVAQSQAKKELESPAIGESIAYHIDRSLEELRPGARIEPKEAAVIGFGAVGRATAEALERRGYEVFVYDQDPEAMQRAHDAGFETGARDEVLGHGHLLVGCTGTHALSLEDYEKLPDGAVLANGASGDHELGCDRPEFAGAEQRAGLPAVDLDGYAQGTFGGEPVTLGDTVAAERFRHRVVRTEGGKEHLVLRSGFVVNMTHGMPPEYAQFILSLLLSGCLQAAKTTEPGLKELDDVMQQFVVAGQRELLAQRGLTLEAPDFRGLASWDV